MENGKNKNNSGQLLLESVIAITALIIGLLGILGLLARSFSLNKIIVSRYTAAYLAAEGIEVVKNLIDGNAVAGAASGAWNRGLFDGFYELAYNFDLNDLVKTEINQARYLCFDSQKHIFDYSCYQSSPPETAKPALFKRIVEIENISDANGDFNQIQVNSRVFWRIGGIDYSADAEDHFFNILGRE